MLLLSICIPSYNRFGALQQNLKNILQSKSEQFEVVIVDNCSPEDIYKQLDVLDPRIRIIRRRKTIYGPKNIGSCLKFARGKYALLCLDKDQVNEKYLDDFIEWLRRNPDICGGYGQIDVGIPLKKGISRIWYHDALAEFGYLSKHPSGNFFRMDCISKYYQMPDNSIWGNSFFHDILLAECASQGAMLLYNNPLIVAEKRIKTVHFKSLSYSPQKRSFYLLPQQRGVQFEIYCKHIDSLQNSIEEKRKVLFRLYQRTIFWVTIDYRRCMSDSVICAHYHMKQRNITFIEMVKYWSEFNYTFLCRGHCRMPLYMNIYFILRGTAECIIKKAFKFIIKLK